MVTDRLPGSPMKVFPFVNLFHCCTHKTASQWFRALFADPLIYDCTGLKAHHFLETCEPPLSPDKVEAWTPPPDGFPPRTIVTSFYIHYQSFLGISKPDQWRGFFVLRDPRDLVVSLYYSFRYSHPLMEPVSSIRERLKDMPIEEGLQHAISVGQGILGMFDIQRDWVCHSTNDERLKIFRFEDLFGNYQFQTIRLLFEHLGMPVNKQELQDLLEKYSFENFSSGRRPGETDDHHHLRRGLPGAWREEFTPKTQEFFLRQTGDLLEVLGYKN